MIKLAKITLLVFVLSIISIGTPRIFPQIFYKNQLEYKHYHIYSNDEISSNIYTILDSTILLTNNTFITKSTHDYNVFLCNSYFLFWMHTFLGRSPSGASDFVSNNIYIANYNLKHSIVANSLLVHPLKGRDAQSVIAHEQVHIMLRDQLGLWRYRNLAIDSTWKIEGVCEWIALKDKAINYKEIFQILEAGTYRENPFHRYQIYRFVIDYLISKKNFKLMDIVNSKYEFEKLVNGLKIKQRNLKVHTTNQVILSNKN
jgi:hypothetical protein